MARCAVRRCGRKAAEESPYCPQCHRLWREVGSPEGEWAPFAYQLDASLDPADDVDAWLYGDAGAREAYREKREQTPKPANARSVGPKPKRAENA